jgi:predicted nucleotidyltransferase
MKSGLPCRPAGPVADAAYARRAAERRAEVLPRTIAALEALAGRGVDAGVIGSVARDEVLPHSDVDFLILDGSGVGWPEIVGIVENHVYPAAPVHVLFLDSVRPERRHRFLKDLRRARDLRRLLVTA